MMGASRFSVVILLLLIVGLVAPARGQSDEAAALDKRVVELHSSGKAADAIPLAKQSLELREKK